MWQSSTWCDGTLILQDNKAKSGRANETQTGLAGVTLRDFDKTIDMQNTSELNDGIIMMGSCNAWCLINQLLPKRKNKVQLYILLILLFFFYLEIHHIMEVKWLVNDFNQSFSLNVTFKIILHKLNLLVEEVKQHKMWITIFLPAYSQNTNTLSVHLIITIWTTKSHFYYCAQLILTAHAIKSKYTQLTICHANKVQAELIPSVSIVCSSL